MLDAAPGALLQLNRGTDANRLTDLVTLMSNVILKSSKLIFGMQKGSKFNVPGWNERAKKLNARQGGSEPLEYCGATQKWSTCKARM